jgi:hypothetical protein
MNMSAGSAGMQAQGRQQRSLWWQQGASERPPLYAGVGLSTTEGMRAGWL